MKTIKTSQLIEAEKIAHSITVAPVGNIFEVTYYLREKKKNGYCRMKTVKIDSIIEDTEIPQISNDTVKHLGYKIYKHLVKPDFYINLYYNS